MKVNTNKMLMMNNKHSFHKNNIRLDDMKLVFNIVTHYILQHEKALLKLFSFRNNNKSALNRETIMFKTIGYQKR